MSGAEETAEAKMTPTRVRFRVVAFAVAMAAITYFDRVCISTLAPSIMKDLALSKVQMSFVFSAFTLAYAAFEIPTAWWGTAGGRPARADADCPLVVRLHRRYRTRAGLRLAARHPLPVRRRRGGRVAQRDAGVRLLDSPAGAGKVQGIFFMGAHLAGGVTPALVALLTTVLSWRQVFFVFGILGTAWATSWFACSATNPASSHP